MKITSMEITGNGDKESWTYQYEVRSIEIQSEEELDLIMDAAKAYVDKHPGVAIGLDQSLEIKVIKYDPN